MGVKSLWHLLTPVGRPVMLETIEGKAMAIDSSIWIYQFQATMRDKDGRALVNAHVLGFLRRICKLLFYGIKPVFVFDGGAPALKRATINERRRKKSGAAAGHAQLAERLLAAQLRREALNHASLAQSSKGKGKAPAGPVLIDEHAVYLEDVDNSMPKTPVRKTQTKPKDSPSSSSKKKNRFHDHDPYRLPDVDLGETIANVTRSGLDPRLATEEELRTFIEEMRPEDFDVTSPAFRELPTEVQYEIIGDLRLKSRQTSYRRLQNMLKNAPTPLDFSRQQIKNLQQRNSLTQQLLTTTDSIGKAHISIPVRIASERNKEYILVKNESQAGGWILGIRDDGIRTKPIEIDQDTNNAEDLSEGEIDEEMEQVNIPETSAPDRDLREYQQEMALSAIAARRSPKRPAVLAKTSMKAKSKAIPLFELSDEELPLGPDIISSDDDEELAIGIQASMDDVAAKGLRSASPMNASSLLASDSISTSHNGFDISTPLKTALSFANAGTSRRTIPSVPDSPLRSLDWPTSRAQQNSPASRHHPPQKYTPSDNMTRQQITTHAQQVDTGLSTPGSDDDSNEDMEEIITVDRLGSPVPENPRSNVGGQVIPSTMNNAIAGPSNTGRISDDSRQNNSSSSELPSRPSKVLHSLDNHEPDILNTPEIQGGPSNTVYISDEEDTSILPITPNTSLAGRSPPKFQLDPFIALKTSSPQVDAGPVVISDAESKSSSRSSSPLPDLFTISRPPSPPAESWDAANEVDVAAEEGEFARFVSQVKGKDIDDVRREIDDEIKSLNHQKKLAMRDSEEITQQMIAQIMTMLRLFGIPYITAPMEAEAQCATLVSLGLVEGIITDDSDVFLFGGLRVFKNMFNQSKTVECFFLRDLERELGLDRNTLIRLAYLLGSDYVEGLPGVGPVLAMEVLREFPGEDGLHKFKEWWTRVQTGKDSEEDSKSTFRKRFKKKFKDLYLEKDWPDSAVRDAYLHPTVDDSDEPFKWGLPDLDALRDFFDEELGWPQKKVDELLLPIIQKMRKRQQAAALNKQGNLNEFFDVTAGSGTYAPRKRQAYSSKRLQQVVSEYRTNQAKLKDHATTDELDGEAESGSNDEEKPARKRAKSGIGSRKKPTRVKATGKGKKVQKTKGSKAGERRSGSDVASSSSEEYKGEGVAGEEPLRVQLRPRPKPAYRENA